MSAPEPESIHAAKAAIRAEVRAALRLMSQRDREKITERAWIQLEETDAWRGAHRVMLYAPVACEPDLDRLWDRGGEWLAARNFCYPRIVGRELEVRAVTSPNQLRPATFGLREPDPAQTTLVEPATIDLVIVPGLAFTREGDRLGWGGGFYDRFVRALPATVSTAALAFACQMRPTLPTEPHDQRVQIVVTG